MQYNTHFIAYMQQIYNEKQHNNKKTSLTCTAMYNPGTLNDSNIISIEKNDKEIIFLVMPPGSYWVTVKSRDSNNSILPAVYSLFSGVFNGGSVYKIRFDILLSMRGT
jgi:hypothetical protein